MVAIKQVLFVVLFILTMTTMVAAQPTLEFSEENWLGLAPSEDDWRTYGVNPNHSDTLSIDIANIFPVALAENPTVLLENLYHITLRTTSTMRVYPINGHEYYRNYSSKELYLLDLSTLNVSFCARLDSNDQWQPRTYPPVWTNRLLNEFGVSGFSDPSLQDIIDEHQSEIQQRLPYLIDLESLPNNSKFK